jgi:hypothetical protein
VHFDVPEHDPFTDEWGGFVLRLLHRLLSLHPIFLPPLPQLSPPPRYCCCRPSDTGS